MPRPCYIVCCETAVEDKRTNLLSLINVVERLEFQIGRLTPQGEIAPQSSPAQPAGRPTLIQVLQLRVIVVWMKLPEDNPEDCYEHQLRLHFPNGAIEEPYQSGDVQFRSDDRPLSRFVIDMHFPPVQQAGIFRVESRIRKVGGDWVSQDYPIMISAAEQPAAEEAAPS